MSRGDAFQPGVACEELETALFELGPALDVTAPLRSDLQHHAASCARCATLLTEMRELNSALRELADADAQEALPPHAEARLLQAFRERHGSDGYRKAAWHAAALAAAAVVLLILGLAIHRFMAAEAGRQTASNLMTAVPKTGPATPLVNDGDASVTEDSDNFLALAYGDGESNPEDGAIVRVLISRATLASMGIPVSDINDERVPAEMVIGEDGTPQAIRLVSQDRESEF